MPRCRGCSREVVDATALSCPHCGAPLLASAATAAATVAAAQAGPVDSARFPPGHIFGARYRIVSLLGRGATGDVYRADDLRLEQPVALKLLMTAAGYGHEAVLRFVREVRLARGISHPNVCRVYDIGDADGWHYLSMEYVDGETLASLLRRIGRLPHEKALDIARQLCAGLAAAHDRGVLHRDLKPANIMVDGRGRIRIMDFGLAIPNDGPSVRDVAGTPGYMAPEQLSGGRITERTDLYALGLVLHEIFAGRRFRAGDKAEIHGDIAAVIDRCLEPDPSKRPDSAISVAAVLPPSDAIPVAFLLGATAWALVWTAFSWLAYIAFEPYVRRWWPMTLTSWTRLLRGRVRDPLVGRDVLLGVLAGIAMVAILALRFQITGSAPPEIFAAPALESVRSPRHVTAAVMFGVTDAQGFVLGGFLFLVVLRLIARNQLIAIALWILVVAPTQTAEALGAGDVWFGWDLLLAVALGLLSVAIMLQLGLLAAVVALTVERLMTHVPMTLDPNVWYAGSAYMTLLIVFVLAIYGFVVALAGRPAFGGEAVESPLRRYS